MAATAKSEMSAPVTSYLKLPYARVLVPESDGTFRGEILEFPGCFATGDNPNETLVNLEEAASDWVKAAIDGGQTIPEPIENTEFSGRLVLRLPKSLHKKATLYAQRDGVSSQPIHCREHR